MKGLNVLKASALTAAMGLPGLVFCQSISVTVNGEPVVFQGVGPRQVNGRVMVPLRGVLEKLGAYVGFDGPSKTVTATKTGVNLTLHLGDTHANVNGRDVILDVPPQEFAGSTMVPLRFVGEALGADVRWNAATYTVNITTTDSGANQQIDPNQYTPPRNNPPAGRVTISSFDIDHTGTFRGGEEMHLSLVGTPGGEATFSIPGVIQDIPMTETQPGVYTGSFRVPTNSPINITKANAVARLRVNGSEQMIQSGGAFGFDTQPPVITAVTPDPNSRVTRDRPNISATYTDGTGSGVDPASVEIRIDNRPVTQDAQITDTFTSYRPDRALSGGMHEVTLTMRDRAGNPVTKTWTFHVVTNSDVIRSFSYDAGGQQLLPGTDVTFTLVGEPGDQATFTVGDRIVNRPMNETQPGRYVGTYTIRRNDHFDNVPVTAKLTNANGDTFTYEAPSRFSTIVRTLEGPTITDPADGTTVGSQVVLRGTAAPGSKVQIRIDYTKTALGIFKMKGTVTEVEVTADDRGRWSTDPIDMSTGIGGGGATFNVTAVTVGSNGKKSPVAKLTLQS